ncbi:uncharacterized protein [Littorina saxatilis]|uniref:JmjC domain-containing protein n=1 Tax=Littorina saxatilis TaxID=31220 RepID=A0AAN9BZ84_9CAEN
MAVSKEQDTFNPEELFQDLYNKAVTSGLTQHDISKLPALADIRVRRKNSFLSCFLSTLKYLLLFSILLCLVWFVDWPIHKDKLVTLWFRAAGIHKDDVDLEKCVIRTPDVITDLFRPPVDCSFCQNVTEAERLHSLLPEDFEDFYAYSGRPVVVVDATKNWSALETFSFQFFQGIYSEGSTALKSVESRCQFFPYKTEFRGLGEVFSMSSDRAHMRGGAKPWYIGWSNCDAAAGNVLRQHYQRPYFLPRAAESSKTDWIFMGSPGYGAHMHVDNVHLPSWQAQITGTKRWTLEPPSECYTQCAARLQVDVRPGDIIVLDTNKWFHSTLNIGDVISITIGSEYD